MRRRTLAAGLLGWACILGACGSSPGPGQTGSSSSTGATGATHADRTTTTTTMLASGAQAPRGAIPWKDVGPGWILAAWSPTVATPVGTPPSTVPGESDDLFLVDPEGGRYLITEFPHSADETLSSWSGDGRRALLVGPAGSSTSVTEVDLATGTSHSFTVPASATFDYTNPDGLAVLETTQLNPVTLERLSTTGTTQQVYPSTFGPWGAYSGQARESPDGTTIAMGTTRGGIALVGNTGTVLSELAVPGATYCDPARWWSSTTVLASCQPSNGNGIPLLWLVPTSGSAPTELTATPPAGSGDAGDMSAWQVGSDIYVQDAGGCGYEYLAKLGTAHLTSPVTVPQVVSGDSEFVLGVVGEQIAILTTINCGGGQSVLWFDPQGSSVQVLLGPGVNGGGVQAALLFGTDNGPLF